MLNYMRPDSRARTGRMKAKLGYKIPLVFLLEEILHNGLLDRFIVLYVLCVLTHNLYNTYSLVVL